MLTDEKKCIAMNDFPNLFTLFGCNKNKKYLKGK